jgi:hypothetical protein
MYDWGSNEISLGLNVNFKSQLKNLESLKRNWVSLSWLKRE